MFRLELNHLQAIIKTRKYGFTITLCCWLKSQFYIIVCWTCCLSYSFI